MVCLYVRSLLPVKFYPHIYLWSASLLRSLSFFALLSFTRFVNVTMLNDSGSFLRTSLPPSSLSFPFSYYSNASFVLSLL